MVKTELSGGRYRVEAETGRGVVTAGAEKKADFVSEVRQAPARGWTRKYCSGSGVPWWAGVHL